MFEEVDSLGVSQGQGRGFAQVFDSTYNPVFKEETARLIKEDKEGKAKIEKDISGLDATVWKKAQPALREKMDDLYSYTMQNHRNINKGNTPEKLEYQKKISDIQLFTKEQKLQEDLWIKQFNNVALKKGVYAPEALDILQNYFDDPNLNDPRYIAELPLSFDPINHKLKVVAPMVQKIVESYTLNPGFKDNQGNIIYDKVWETAGPEIEKQMKDNWKALPDSAKSFFETEENYISLANSFREVGAQRNVKQPYVDPNQKAQEKLNLIVTDMVEDTVSIPIGSDDTTKKAFTQGKVPAIQQMPGNFTTNINFPPTEMKKLNAKPLSVFGIYQAKDGKVKSDSYDTDFWTKGVEDQGASEFEPKLVKSYAVFTPKLDSKGNPVDTKNFKKENGELYLLADGKRWIPVNNILLDKENIKNNKFRGVSLGDENVSWVPHIVGTYGKKLSDDQTNFDVAIPYDEGYKNYVGANKGGQDIKNFEAVVNEKDPTILQIKSYSKGTGGKGVQQPTQTKKAPDSTQKQTKIKPMTRDEFNAFAKSKGKVATDDDYKKYLNKLEE